MVSTRSGDKGSTVHQTEAHIGGKHDMRQKPVPAAKRAKTNTGEKKNTHKQDSEKLGDAHNGKDGGKKAEHKDDVKVEEDKEENGSTADNKGTHETSTTKDEPGAVEPGARDEVVPSSILEKGIMYIFFRGKVGIDEPKTIDAVRRTYILLRPIDKGAKLGEGTLGDVGNSRLIAIPKKALPVSGKQRWIAHVDKVNVSLTTLQDQLVEDEEYDPVAEGVYAITSTGRESHLSYLLAHIHNKEGNDIHNVQVDLGVRERASLIISTRNPEYEAPPNAQFPKSPEYSDEIKKQFRTRRWMPTQPSHLDYSGTQFLMIGEKSGIEKALEPHEEDKKAGKEDPVEEMERLQDEDIHRMEGLGDDDTAAIFADLKADHERYPKEPAFSKISQ